MKVTTFGKAGFSLATAVTLSLGLCVTAAHAAGQPPTATQEDPSASAIGQYTLVGAGSDTIQDVEYGISKDLGTYDGMHLNLASWTATGTSTMTYRSGGKAPSGGAAHPNGSGPGYTALKESYGISPTQTATDGVAAGDVDFSRASGFQGTEMQNQTGVVTEIPFAIDAISFAVPAGSPFALTNSGHGLTLADLANIYSGTDQYIDTSDGTLLPTATPLVAGDPVLPIQAFVPKPGSGSRQFFLTQLSKVSSAINVGSNKGDSLYVNTPPPVEGASPAPYVGALMPDGSPVQEHDATILTSVDSSKVAAIAPFSAAKFIGYHNQVIADPDSGKTAGVDYKLIPFDSASGPVLPYTDNGGTYVPNPAYETQGVEGNGTVTREVFNIIPTAVVQNPNASVKYRALYDTFVGAGSKFCLDTKTIEAYGFLVDSNCGDTSRTADTASASTPTVSHSAAVAGKSTVVTVAVQSNGNGGGTVSLVINGALHTGVIAAGKTTTSFTVATPKAGKVTYGGGASGFTPNLAGVAAAPIASGSFAIAKAAPTVKATAAPVAHTAVGKVGVTVTAPGLTPTGKVTVVVKMGKVTKVSRTVALKGGKATATLVKLPRGSYLVYVSYAGDANVSGKALTKLATLTVR